MALGGIGGILVTAPLTSTDSLERLRRLLLRGADIAVVADNPASVTSLATLAGPPDACSTLWWTWISGSAAPAVWKLPMPWRWRGRVAGAPALNFAGLQAYWGNLQQVSPFPERVRRIAVQTERLRAAIVRTDRRRPASGHCHGWRHRQPPHRCRKRAIHRDAAGLLPFHGFLLFHDQHLGK